MKRLNFVTFILLVAVTFTGCETKTPEYFYTQNQLKYKYHDISDDGRVPGIGDYLSVYMNYSNSADSVFFDSYNQTYDGQQLIVMGKPQVKGGIEEGFAQLMEGDSVTFFISADKLFKYYHKTEVPYYLNPNEEINVRLRLVKVESPIEYQNRKQYEKEEAEKDEFHIMQEIILDWEKEQFIVEDISSVFIARKDTNCVNEIMYGDPLKLIYKGYFPNGKVFYDNTNSGSYDEYVAGVIGQNIEGLRIALVNMCYGESAKVLVPSYLGFGDDVIEMGMVPQYSPVIFEVTILPKEEIVKSF